MMGVVGMMVLKYGKIAAKQLCMYHVFFGTRVTAKTAPDYICSI